MTNRFEVLAQLVESTSTNDPEVAEHLVPALTVMAQHDMAESLPGDPGDRARLLDDLFDEIASKWVRRPAVPVLFEGDDVPREVVAR
jgi:hypothetical protein